MHIGDTIIPDLYAAQGDDLRHGFCFAAEKNLHGVFDQHTHTDGADQRNVARGLKKFLIADFVDHNADQTRCGKAEKNRQKNISAGQGCGKQRGKRADHNHLTKGEGHQAHHTHNNGVANGKQRINCALADAIDKLFYQIGHFLSSC